MSTTIAPLTPPVPHEWPAYLATHGRSFWFATALMPEPHRSRIAGVYAYCRFTDDLVDRGPSDRATVLRLLDRWLARSRAAYETRDSDIPLLRDVMRDMAESEVPFAYVEELAEGMRMDVLGQRYESVDELRQYCHRVASVVGLWLTELFGVHDRWTLDRAARLGTAMQLTNIVRDVGEDLGRGRLYLPSERMRAHGVSEPALVALRASRNPIPDGYVALMRELIAVAEDDYRAASEGIPRLPVFFRSAVAVAARVYAAIHEAVREGGYDTLRRRAATSMARKIALARLTLIELNAPTEPLDRAIRLACEAVARPSARDAS